MIKTKIGRHRRETELEFEDIRDEQGRLLERKVKSWNGNAVTDEHKADDTRLQHSAEARRKRNLNKQKWYYRNKAREDALEDMKRKNN